MAAERSGYFQSLDFDTKKRYLAKTSLLDGANPYALKQLDLMQYISLLVQGSQVANDSQAT